MQHGEKAGVSGVTTEGAEHERAAAGGGVGLEDGEISMEEALEGRAGGLATDGDLEHVDHQDAKRCPGAAVRGTRGAAGAHRTEH